MKRLTVDSRKQAIEISFSGGQLVPFMFCPENGQSLIPNHILAGEHSA